MFFAKDEIVELDDNKKYLVLDSIFLDNDFYYKVKEVNDKMDTLIGNYKFITASNKDGELFINDKITTEKLEKLNELFN